MEYLVIGGYLFFLTFILLYSIHQLYLVSAYLKAKNPMHRTPIQPTIWPKVTIQLPLYNERYVANRLINCICQFDYDKTLLQIQVLDDSTDDTSEILAIEIEKFKSQGFNIEHIRRTNRVDFKAGALKHGLEKATGEFVAIFDADFLPEPDYLRKTVPYFQDENVGVVQVRWGHLNEKYSALTQIQAYALNAHFSIEQKGRNSKNHFINFNGTAGIWRREAIENAGNWQGDTLTEDLDLSYRAQLNNWKFVYLEDEIAPAELPTTMNGIKSQQYRWAKGAAECAGKNLSKVLRDKNVKFSTKYAAAFHLLNSFVWVCVFLSGMLLLPFLKIIGSDFLDRNLLGFIGIYHFSFFALLIFYVIANWQFGIKSTKDFFKILLLYPLFLALSMGLSLYISSGVIKGYLGIKTAFVRTPKFNISSSLDQFKGKQYTQWKMNWFVLAEILCLGYFAFSSYYAYQNQYWISLPFLAMQCLGFGMVLFYAYRHAQLANKKG
ncbi:MAG: glycosyltransferase family 2 protein [Bacteroidetes bacterium]|nr:glycosyltransferase family 2 protein [Bacteroidota bacterium]